ncbi:MAG: KH domain-containing protein [Coriobacteriaceae bacterium]|jgi:spoIIIJ-associated protein|nr:KH domain-containing protein [Atopobium sp.]MCH4081720.1 KH domain-containing protein [Atopobiaceae bacterium]RRF94111.1 MAG: KH domain-containing protein [Coriobacteriaceae bacterium]MCI1345189.1 KH domain-containing protein [Atopobiaceae bacterium]MCI1498726.1 KH domain-containing protein [Atopobiaceae bacterium]
MEEEIEAEAQADAAEATSDMAATIKEKYEAGQELTDDELDFVADAAIRSIKDILSYFGETGSSIDEYDGDNGELILDINGGDLAVLIGRHGRTLDALQMVVSSLLSSTLGFHYPIVVDIEGYKSRRKNKVQSLARSAAARAKKQHGSVSLPPMNAYERRLVHLALVDDDSVVTHSEGEEPMRHVVVTLVNK